MYYYYDDPSNTFLELTKCKAMFLQAYPYQCDAKTHCFIKKIPACCEPAVNQKSANKMKNKNAQSTESTVQYGTELFLLKINIGARYDFKLLN